MEMPGVDANEINPPNGREDQIELALDENKELSSSQYRAFNVSIKNNSDSWLRLEKINMAFPTLSGQPEVLLDKDLDSYVSSISRRNGIDQYNKALAISSVYAIGTIGGIAAGASGQRNLAIAGLGIGAGALTYGAVDGILESKNRAQFQAALPDNHLFKPFDIAPKMVLSRWIIVKLPENAGYEQARIELTEVGQAKRSFLVKERKQQNRRGLK
jgi:hypothetical protein